MDITPVDLLNRKFPRKALGYDASEVDSLLHSTANAMEQLLAEKAAMQERLEDLEAHLARYKEMEGTLNNALVLAQKTADDLKANSQREAELMLREAQETVRRETEEAGKELAALKQTKDRFVIEFRALLKSYLNSCEGGNDGRKPTEPAAP